MGKIICQKKFNLLGIFGDMFMYMFYRFIGLLVFLLYSNMIYAQKLDQQKLPLLYNIGLIPLKVEKLTSQDILGLTTERIDLIEKAYYSAFYKSGRFNLINKDVVKILWNSEKGREELVALHKLHLFAFLSLVIKGDEDMVLSLRLLSPSLKLYLLEEENISVNWVLSSSEHKIYDKIENLVFRLNNRLPVDCFVLSIQGKYVTLSCGTQHFVVVGDIFDVVKPYITFVHPVTGVWIKYNLDLVGKLRIIEVKERTSIGEIISLNKEYGIDLGDGFKNSKLSSRLRFDNKIKQQPIFSSVQENDVQVVFPLYDESKGSETNKIVSSMSSTDKYDKSNKSEVIKDSDKNSDVSLDNKLYGVNDSSSDDDIHKKEGDFIFKTVSDFVVSKFDMLSFRVGHVFWTIRGYDKFYSTVPIWLINDIGVSLYRNVNDNINFKLMSDIGFGFTDGGSYLSFGIDSQLFYLLSKREFTKYFIGPLGSFYTSAVYSEVYGGMTLIKAGVVVAREDALKLNRSDIKLLSEFSLIPLAVGNIGGEGNLKGIDSIFEWQLKESIFVENLKFRDFQLGGELLLSNAIFKASSVKLKKTRIGIFLTASRIF